MSNSSYLYINVGNVLNTASKTSNHLTCDSLANSESNYRNIKMNVDSLKMIQLGITLTNDEGMSPSSSSCTWQFNFKFDLNTDTYLKESISLLEIAGIDFNKFNKDGIDIDTFAENFISSGIVLNDKIKWITFHGVYDLAYLLKALSNQALPEDEQTFLEYLHIYFPHFYDLRCMIKKAVWLKGSLNRIAAELDVERIGQTHQAGSDSLVTSRVFFKLIQYYGDFIDLDEDRNKLFGCEIKPVVDVENTKLFKNEQTSGSNCSNSFYSIYTPKIPKTNVYYAPFNTYTTTPNILYTGTPKYPNPNNFQFEYGYYPNPYYGVRK